MFTLRLVGGFCVRVVVFYGLLMVPWPGLENAYGALFRGGGEALFGSFGPGGVVHFEPLATSHPMRDTEIVLQNRHSPGVGGIPTSSRYRGYITTAFVVALVLATPIPWRRRWWALCWGLILVNAYVVARVGLTLLNAYSGDHSFALFKFPVFWKQALSFITEVVTVSLIGVYLFPVFIWVMVCFGRDDLKRIVQRDGTRVRRDTGSGGNTGVAES